MTATRIPRQPRSKNTKTRITKAAFTLFSQKGIHGTNTKEITEKAGVATGSFYAYYKNKKQLLLEILEDFLNNTYLLIWKDLHKYDIRNISLDDVKSIIENVFLAYDVAPQFLSQTHALRYSDPEINRIYERERQREVDQILKLIETNRDRLTINDPFAAAIILHNAVEHVAHTAKFIGSEIEESRLINELSNIIYYYFVPRNNSK
ncbi:MAG: TetR/AcrR family transcriptional regulator [Proteobacteria bacterium]|nr:TetR/AcrR family transcriptional regulator [Pseudomonadota bacterium]